MTFFSIASKFILLDRLLHYFAYEYMLKQEAEVVVALFVEQFLFL